MELGPGGPQDVRFVAEADSCAAANSTGYSMTSSANARSLSGSQFQCLGGLHVDHQLEGRWLFNWKIGGFRTLENAINEKRRSPRQIR